MIAPNQGFASGVFIHKMEILRFLKLKHYYPRPLLSKKNPFDINKRINPFPTLSFLRYKIVMFG